jgi:hypothetical protein
VRPPPIPASSTQRLEDPTPSRRRGPTASPEGLSGRTHLVRLGCGAAGSIGKIWGKRATPRRQTVSTEEPEAHGIRDRHQGVFLGVLPTPPACQSPMSVAEHGQDKGWDRPRHETLNPIDPAVSRCGTKPMRNGALLSIPRLPVRPHAPQRGVARAARNGTRSARLGRGLGVVMAGLGWSGDTALSRFI